MTSVGSWGPGAWLASTDFNATGKSFTDFNWTVNADKLQAQRYVQGINLDGLTLAGSLRDSTFAVATISLPKKDLISGTIKYHFTDKHPWEAKLEGEHWPFRLIPKTELGFELAVSGDNQLISLDRLLFKKSGRGSWTAWNLCNRKSQAGRCHRHDQQRRIRPAASGWRILPQAAPAKDPPMERSRAGDFHLTGLHLRSASTPRSTRLEPSMAGNSTSADIISERFIW